ncbi:MAG: hypothetical protein KF693_05705 [Nitrospira sp.]|nr:hypothetical protein [Nitrospira sp.]
MSFFVWVAERVNLFTAGVFVASIPVWLWRLSREDEATRVEVEFTRDKWEATSTYEREYQKVRSKWRRISWAFIAVLATSALVIVCAHVLVRP